MPERLGAILLILFLLLARYVTVPGKQMISGREEAMQEMDTGDLMLKAAAFVADKAKEGCEGNAEIARLRIRLGIFFMPRIQGVTAQGETVEIWDAEQDDGWNYSVLDEAWTRHSGERTYFEDYERLVAEQLEARNCPPCEFVAPDGQQGELLAFRQKIWEAIGDRTEVGEILEAVTPVWKFPAEESMLLTESGVYSWFYLNGEMFELSWTYQVPDEESDEFYQLSVSLYYPPEEENRGIQECEFYDGDASLPEAVKAMAACRWALGRQAQVVQVSISGT